MITSTKNTNYTPEAGANSPAGDRFATFTKYTPEAGALSLPGGRFA